MGASHRLVSSLGKWSAAALLLATAATARAQSAEGFALDRFNPSERGSDWFVLESLDFRGRTRLAFGLTGELAIKPLVIYDTAGDEQTVVVDNQAFVHLGGSLVLADTLRIGVNVPLAVIQSGDSGTLNGVTYTAPDGFALGDVRVGVDARVVGRYRGPFNLAVGAQVHLPTGDQDQFDSDGQVRAAGHLLVAGDAGMLAYALKAGFMFRGLDDLVDGAPFGSEVFGGAALGIRAIDKHLLLGAELSGATVVSDSDGFLKKRSTPAELLFGVHYFASNGLRLGVGGGPGLTRALGTPTARVVATLEWMPWIPEAPPPDPDRDRDGIPNAVDACPDEPGVASDDNTRNGCPPPPPPPDRDGDGVLDAQDACPDVPGVKTDDPKTSGCPPDKDGDGVPDKDDACPDVAGVKTDDPKTNGCPPPPPDTDGDGVPDPDDACPTAAGPRDPDPKKNGCPAVRVEKQQIIILEQIKFRTNSAVILRDSFGILDAVATTMKEHPEILRVEVQGHTDNVGGKRFNQRLSARRATSVMKALVKRGVPKSKLVARGFGLTVPIDTNDTPEGRQNNRRVEFHIIEVAK